ncbi:3-oxoacyl-[acyl-carrier-protein] synthase-3/beta-ketoacyl ACP synthase [Streptomyces sp. TverLS-915]|uniref:ketoacyl-ACP synthase III n=1 Tax=unclassified Streptomyces TaxID=2593676 RepID=UPI0001B5445A|nr:MULTISPECIES: ketoacyl-ACP synthase III [unclassified Streptomyces]EFL03690.1 AlnI starter unit ketoacyl synthase [Streptomyces sp. SPB78]SCD48254.1 3-oxoacyl-[acyl-carrier-protein] synthase-3/beta-ketoacyl ACP synthase [Streptomyces sp. TverLS-915]
MTGEAEMLGTRPVVHSGLLGVGGYRPRRSVDNAELCATVASTPEWIETRSGIRARGFAAPDETLRFMGRAAAEKALARAGVLPDGIDLVLVASMSRLEQTPPLAVLLAEDLGARAAAGLDVSGACAGFCHALALASDAVRAGSARHVLVVGTERMTDLVERADRTVSVLFADGAGAAVVGPSARPGISPPARGAAGRYAGALRMDRGWDAFAADPSLGRPWMRMDGRRVFRWAMDEVTPRAAELLRESGIEPGALDAFVPHQANLRMIELMAERLGLPERTAVARDVVRAGNTSAASVPLALEALLDSGEVGSGDRALLVGFGAGLNYAAQVVELP